MRNNVANIQGQQQAHPLGTQIFWTVCLSNLIKTNTIKLILPPLLKQRDIYTDVHSCFISLLLFILTIETTLVLQKSTRMTKKEN